MKAMRCEARKEVRKARLPVAWGRLDRPGTIAARAAKLTVNTADWDASRADDSRRRTYITTGAALRLALGISSRSTSRCALSCGEFAGELWVVVSESTALDDVGENVVEGIGGVERSRRGTEG